MTENELPVRAMRGAQFADIEIISHEAETL
jgi:hypothetical protein